MVSDVNDKAEEVIYFTENCRVKDKYILQKDDWLSNGARKFHFRRFPIHLYHAN